MPIPTYDERVGTLLGAKYRLGKILGRGGMGAVFEARHEWTGRPVAVKILNHEHVENPEAAERFLREARVAAGLKHPNVVDVLDMGEDADHTVYMVLELLEGEALSRILALEHSLSFERAAELLIPVMRAVAHAHARNVVHRDLKPENILIHRDSAGTIVPKILDFGIAKALDDKPTTHATQTGFVMGTPAYMSPEQGEGIPERIGPPADVWSMGVVWYEALTGSLPFDGPTATSILLAVNSARFVRLVKRLPSLPVSLANVIDKAMVRDVSRRYSDMGAFLDALQKAMLGTGDPVPLTGRASRPSVEASPWHLVAQPDGLRETRVTEDSFDDPVIELGPVVRVSVVDAITMGESTAEPVVLLRRPRRKARSFPFTAAILAALAGIGLTTALLTRHRGSGTPVARAVVAPSTPAVAPAVMATPPAAPNTIAPATPAVVTAAPSPPPRRSRHSQRDDNDLTRPLAIYIDPPRAVPVDPPAPAAAHPTPAPAPAPVEATPATPTRTSLPRENAPLTDYDHAP